MHISFSKTRQFFIFFSFALLFSAIFLRLVYIQIISNKELSELANKQHKILVRLQPRRGTIYDRLNRVLAMYLDTVSIYAVPKEIGNKPAAARILAEKLDLDREKLLYGLNKNNYFMWVTRKVDDSVVRKAKALNMDAVHMTNEPKRFYPGGRLACHVLGVIDIDNKGLEGVELCYDSELKGEYGFRRSLRDAKKREVISFRRDSLPARDGDNLVLTIDEVIQHILENEVERIANDFKPESVSIVALNPETGGMLGMANYPSFDPNNFSGVNADSRRNRAISDSFEPGSVFKIVTASAALEENVVDFDTEFFCENGNYKVGSRTLHDFRPYGTLKFREIIEKSSNIGVVKVAGKLGKKNLANYIRKFNFDRETGIDLPGEVSGIMRDPEKWSYVDMTTIPMGQGIAVTTLQLAAAISAIANKGVLMRPYVVKEILSPEGAVIRENRPEEKSRVMSEETADKVKELLKGVVDRGTGTRAKPDNFEACGKTGTAQKINPQGGYYNDRYVASFIGFAPYDKPKIALAISVNSPKKQHLGGQVAAPAFKNIMDKVLPYMEAENGKNEVKKSL